MTKNIFNFIYLFFLILINTAHSSVGVFEEDIELSKKIPLISGRAEEIQEIKKGNKAALTLCSIPLNNLFGNDHIALVFEIKHPLKDEIDLFSVHFGGDGNSSEVERGRPTIDSSRDTLRKIFKGKKTTVFEVDYVDPLYTRKIGFIIEKDQAVKALKRVEDDHGLSYSLPGWTYGNKSSYNCCTYVSSVLKDAGIETGFEQSWNPIKSATLLLSCCESYKLKQNQYRYVPVDYFNFLELGMDEYRLSVEKLFENALNFKKSNNYDESMKYLLETAKRGHCVSQCFIGFCYCNNDKVEAAFKNIVTYAQSYHNFPESDKNDISIYYNLIVNYNEFACCSYFKKSFLNRDEREAFDWMKRSADKGFSRAQSDLSVFYKEGKGTSINKEEAVAYAKKAFEKKDPFAALNLNQWYKEAKEEATEQAHKSAQKYRRSVISNTNESSYEKLESEQDINRMTNNRFESEMNKNLNEVEALYSFVKNQAV